MSEDDLVAWIRASLEAVEATARAADACAASPWATDGGLVKHAGPEDYPKDGGLWDSEGCRQEYQRLCMEYPVAEHVALHDPRAVLAGVAADRAILDVCLDYLHEYEAGVDPCAQGVLWSLAGRYRHMPGWRDEWETA